MHCMGPIFWGKCRDLFSMQKKEQDRSRPLPDEVLINLLARHTYSETDESIEAIEKGVPPPLPDLPYDIITNILIRLPAKCIFQLWHHTNLLCKLTTDPYFTRAHLDRQRLATPTIVAHSRWSIDNNIKLYLFDGSSSNGYCKNIESTSLDLSSWNCEWTIFICGSYDGFLLFNTMWDPAIFCILNPITKEQVILTSPPCPNPELTPAGWPSPQNRETWVCGFYFHPNRKEYEVICVRMLADTKMWEFQILNLKTKQRTSVGSCSYPPSRRRWRPVFINGMFYWLVDCNVYLAENGVLPSLSESILIFSLETEEFSTMEIVKPSYDFLMDRRYKRIQLFDFDGELGLLDPWASLSDPQVAVIWVFNNSSKCWDKKYSMSSSPIGSHWGYFREIDYIKMKGEFIAYPSINLYNEWYVYNLSSATWKVFGWERLEKDNYATTIHTHSLVSLDAADSVIPIQW